MAHHLEEDFKFVSRELFVIETSSLGQNCPLPVGLRGICRVFNGVSLELNTSMEEEEECDSDTGTVKLNADSVMGNGLDRSSLS